jgi:alpha-beta hydrolase superfamily lysophospholipase
MTADPARGSLRTTDGLTLSTAFWRPETQPKALALLAHGHAEHLGRYGLVIDALLANGFVVAGQDHRTHGRSDGEPRALVRRFDDLVDDFRIMALRVQAEHPGLPVVLVGHSMGGLLAARYALRYQAELSALVLSGPAFVVVGVTNPLLQLAVRLISLPFPTMPVPRTEGDDLSTDPAIDTQFAADPLCYHGKTRLRTVSEIVHGGKDALRRAPTLTIPLLAMNGALDPIVSPTGTEEFERRAGSTDKTLRIWSGMKHEIFNEVDGDGVIDYTIDWLNARIPSS